MRIACIGAGPAGLYFAIAAKLRDPRHEIVVHERNPAGSTYGWGVTFGDDLLDAMHRIDPRSTGQIGAPARAWRNQTVRVGQGCAHLGGYGSTIGRRHLLSVLSARAIELDVDLRFADQVGQIDPAQFDVVVAADGARSQMRGSLSAQFGTRHAEGRNLFAWLGTRHVFGEFRFAFERTGAGWIWLHAYPHDAATSTVIVECGEATCDGLSLGVDGARADLRRLEQIFARHLGGQGLLSPTPAADQLPWQRFDTVTNEVWHHDNVVLLGDAAHTTHFTIGLGTTLAIGDAIALVECLTEHQEISAGLAAYSARRPAEIAAAVEAARRSQEFFEALPGLGQCSLPEFAYRLWARGHGGSPWRHQVHRATQFGALRGLRRTASRARGLYWRGRRRIRPAATPVGAPR